MAGYNQPGGLEPQQHSVFQQMGREAWWLAWVVTLVGSSSVSAFLSQLLTAARPGTAGVGEVETLVLAGLAALALTLGVAFAVGIYEFSDDKLTGYPLAGMIILSLLAGAGVATALGVATVGVDDLLLASSGYDNLVAKVFAILGAFFVAYGPVAAVQGALVGLGLGHWASALARHFG